MKLVDEIKILQHELSKMLIENTADKNEILAFSVKLDKLIAKHYLESDNTDNK